MLDPETLDVLQVDEAEGVRKRLEAQENGPMRERVRTGPGTL